MKLSTLALLFWLTLLGPKFDQCYGFKPSWLHSSVTRKKTWLRDSYCEQVGMQGEFDQYVLAEQYSTVLCHSNATKYSCDKLDQAAPWTLHGLWPSYRGDRYLYSGDDNEPRGPSCCDPNRIFDVNSIMSLLPRLCKEWSDLKRNGEFYSFWKHEWMKHGTCCPLSLQPEEVYFSTVLDLYEKGLNFEHLLQWADITPSRNRPYYASEIVSAFEMMYEVGVVSEIICSDNNNSTMNYPQLMEIRICLSMADLKPTKCLGLDQVHIGRACGGANGDPMIIYPPTNFT